jgi:nitrogen fixation NifU-like protein
VPTPTDGTASTGLAALYQDRILEHYRRPRHKGDLPGATGMRTVKNPLCGDDITVRILLEQGVVRDAAFTGSGCSITQAVSSMLMELARGRTAVELAALAQAFDAMLAGGAIDPRLGELEALVGVVAFPQRHKCARLPWQALLGAIGEDRSS